MGPVHITIPTLCHEDWALMSPQEKGRFCDKCSKTVIDFSSKSPTEIQEFIRKHEHEKLCGRFRNDQLKKPVRLEVSFPFRVKNINVSQVFLLSLLIAFGTSLFSCTTHNNETVGELNLTDTGTNHTETDSAVYFTTGLIIQEPTKSADPVETLKGEIENSDTGDLIPDTVIELPPVDIVEQAIPIVDCYLVGAIAITRYIPEETDSLTDSVPGITNVPDENVFPSNESFVVYPNPTHGIVNLKFNISGEVMAGVELYDINFRLIRTLLPSQHIQTGERELQFDISDQPPATYLLRVIKGERVETRRIVIL